MSPNAIKCYRLLQVLPTKFEMWLITRSRFGVAVRQTSNTRERGSMPSDLPAVMAMAAGEYVSVHSQADTEQAEL